MYHDIMTKRSGNILFAPPKELLYCYGGNMKITEFRENNEKYISFEPPMKFEKRIIEKFENFSINSSPTEIIDASSNITNEPIKLKRKVPKSSTQNTLEMSMGIFKS